MNESIAPVCYITDKNYVIPTAVSIRSLIDNYKNESKLDIYIVNTGIDDWQRELLYEYNNKYCEIKIIDINIDRLKKYEEVNYYVTTSCLVKFMLPRLLDKYDRLMYVDGDTIIQGDITQILKFDISQYYAAAVADPAAMLQLNWHKRLERMRYFNGGLLYINCKKFREDNMEEKLFLCKEAHPEYCCMDQDVFNDIFKDRVKYIDIIYNYMEYNIKHYDFTIARINHLYNTNYKSFDEIRNKAIVLHLTNEYKPWIYNDCYMEYEWFRIYKKTPFRDIPLARKSCYPPIKGIRRLNPLLSKESGTYLTSFRLFGIKIFKIPRIRVILNKILKDIKMIEDENIKKDILHCIDDEIDYINKHAR